MNRTLSAILASLLCIPAASPALDLISRITLSDCKLYSLSRSSSGSTISATVTLAPDHREDPIREAGFNVIAARGDVALVSLDIQMLDSLCSVDGVKSVRLGNLNRTHTTLDMASAFSGLDKVHRGAGVTDGSNYLGRGVLLGMMDQGLDPNHINFRNSDGGSRFSAVWTFPGQNGEFEEYLDKAVQDLDTDMPSSFHATYTSGIMAGSYCGKGRLATLSDNGTCAVTDGVDIPFCGAAPEAELVAGCGKLTDANIIKAVENIVAYGKSTGRRPVINLSIGSPGGPFDGSDPVCAYLNEVGREDAIIIAAAGNDGHKNMSLCIGADENTRTKTTYISGLPLHDPENNAPTRYIQINASDNRQPATEILLYDFSSGKEITLLQIPQSGEIESITTRQHTDNEDTAVYSPELARYYSGDITAGSEQDATSGKSQTIIAFSIGAIYSDGEKSALGIRVTADSGQRVEITTDANIQFAAFGIENATVGTPDLSISSLVCGDNIISVGAYVTRGNIPTLDGGISTTFNYFYPAEPGYPAYFSSYTELPDGTSYPTVCAPGNEVVSSYSRYYTSGQPEDSRNKSTACVPDSDGSLHYWRSECGTSAATPVVAGAVATWMEADPTLTAAEVKEIIKKTAHTDTQTQDTDKPARFGAGKFNALDGLNEVLSRKASADGILYDAEHFLLTCDGPYRYILRCIGSETIEATLYNISGQVCISERSSGDALNINTGNISAGLYIIRATATAGGEKYQFIQKIIVR